MYPSNYIYPARRKPTRTDCSERGARDNLNEFYDYFVILNFTAVTD